MSNDISKVMETRAKAKRLVKICEAAELFEVDKRTLRKMAEACGAYHPVNRKLVYIDVQLVDEFICTLK